MQHIDLERYLINLRKLLRDFYQSEKHNSPANGRRDRIQGHLEAAMALGVMSKDALQAVIDDEHLAVFGVSIPERRLAKGNPQL